MLPVNLAKPLERHLQKVKAQHEEDLEAGFGSVFLPDAIARKNPAAAKHWIWQYVFPSSRLCTDPRSSVAVKQRHHINETMRDASRAPPKARTIRDYARTGTLAVRSSLPQLTQAPLIARRMAFQMQ